MDIFTISIISGVIFYLPIRYAIKRSMKSWLQFPKLDCTPIMAGRIRMVQVGMAGIPNIMDICVSCGDVFTQHIILHESIYDTFSSILNHICMYILLGPFRGLNIREMGWYAYV